MATKHLPRALPLASRAPHSIHPLPPRKYHSYTHPPPPGPFNQIESSILREATKHIPSHGFTSTSLALGCQDAGYIAASTNLFPKGAFSLVEWHLLSQREALKKHTDVIEGKNEGRKPMGVGAKVKELTWRRLMANEAIIHRWQEALALLASHPSSSIHELALLSDEIWFLAGDVSVDTSWYTKRASLSTIYAATELFMTTDKSNEFKETRDFMERRFEDGRSLGTTVGSVGQWVGFTAHAGLNVLRSKGMRI